jgi:hypothetical protein
MPSAAHEAASRAVIQPVQNYGRRSSSGSLAKFAAMQRASSLLNRRQIDQCASVPDRVLLGKEKRDRVSLGYLVAFVGMVIGGG